MPQVHRVTSALLMLAITVGAAACSDDDAPDGVASDAGAERPCEPVGAELEAEADTSISVDLTEYTLTPASIEVPAGVVTFVTENLGEEAHELAFLPGGGDVPVTATGEPDEDALGAAGAFELESYGPGQTCKATYDLEPGTYTLFCLVEAPDGKTHVDKGMRGTLTVE
jgi:plastocyanin